MLKKYWGDHPLMCLAAIWALLQPVFLCLHTFTYYADEIRDYFMTAHGLAYGHELGEWYVREGLRSYAIILPFKWIIQVCAWAGVENIFLQQKVLQAAVGLTGLTNLLALWHWVRLRSDALRANWAGVIYLAHPFIWYYQHSLLTEQLVASCFITCLYCLEHLKIRPGSWSHWLGVFSTSAIAALSRLDAMFFLLPLVLGWLWSRRRTLAWQPVVVSGVGVFLVFGFLEQAYTGTFYGPVWVRFTMFDKGTAGLVGATYGPGRIFEDLGLNITLGLMALFLYAFGRTLRQWSWDHLAITCFVAFHAWLPHKEARFTSSLIVVVIGFIVLNLPSHWFAPTVWRKKFFAAWGAVAALAALTAGGFVFWYGQPDIHQQLAYLEFAYPKAQRLVAGSGGAFQDKMIRLHGVAAPVFDATKPLPHGATIISWPPGGDHLVRSIASRGCREVLPGQKADRHGWRHIFCREAR